MIDGTFKLLVFPFICSLCLSMFYHLPVDRPEPQERYIYFPLSYPFGHQKPKDKISLGRHYKDLEALDPVFPERYQTYMFYAKNRKEYTDGYKKAYNITRVMAFIEGEPESPNRAPEHNLFSIIKFMEMIDFITLALGIIVLTMGLFIKVKNNKNNY